LAKEKNISLIFLSLNKKNFTVDIEQLPKYIDKQTKLVSIFHSSNSLGVINSVAEITRKIKEINPDC
jgi:selenocysteine lyase/cysteine desulfurase